jgi:methylase of polypeptide subunit release factors
MNPLLSAVRRVAYRVWHRRVRATFERPDACTLFGLDLVIAPGVLHPRHFASSRLMARYLMSLDLRGRIVADVGTGSGLLGLLAARAGGVVTATDISPVAVECARSNALRNGLDERFRVVVSDVFEGVPTDRRFDLVLTNPPFYRRTPKSVPDRAFAAGVDNGFFSTLARDLPGRLTGNGALLMIHSSDADFAPLLEMLGRKGLAPRIVLESRGFFETLTIREFRAEA